MKPITTLMAFAILGAASLAQDQKPFTLKTQDGTEYKECIVKRVLPNGLQIEYYDGAATIPFSNLPEEIQKKFGYDPIKGEEFSRAQATARAEAQRTAALRSATAKAEKAIRDASLQVELKIIQVLDDGVIAKGTYFQDAGYDVHEGGRTWRAGTYDGTGTIFVVTDTKQWVDGDSISGAIYPAGTYTYTNLSGARAKIRRYATSVEKALQLLASEK